MAYPTQHVVTRFGARPFLRLFLFASIAIAPAASGAALYVTVHVVERALPSMHDADTGLEDAEELEARARLRYQLLEELPPAVFLVTALLSIALPLGVLARRQPRPGRLELDDWGVTELDGEEVRTAIPWAGATVQAAETIDERRRSRRHGHERHRHRPVVLHRSLTVASPSGWVVFVGFRGWMPHWARRRRATGDVDLHILSRLGISGLDSGEPPTDPRDARRGAPGVWRALDAAYGVALGAAGWELFGPRTHASAAGILLLVCAATTLARALRPIRELRALGAEERALAGARALVLHGEESSGVARARDERSVEMALDLTNVRHPDAKLASRRSRVYVVVAPREASEPYRTSAREVVVAVETEQQRLERANLRLASRLETACRVLFATLLAIAGMMLALS